MSPTPGFSFPLGCVEHVLPLHTPLSVLLLAPDVVALSICRLFQLSCLFGRLALATTLFLSASFYHVHYMPMISVCASPAPGPPIDTDSSLEKVLLESCSLMLGELQFVHPFAWTPESTPKEVLIKSCSNLVSPCWENFSVCIFPPLDPDRHRQKS